jgi:hypothetical protein
MKFFQIALATNKPRGALFETRPDAEREVRMLKADDARYAREALSEAGIVVEPSEYVIHEVTR